MPELRWEPKKQLVADLKELPRNPRKISKDAFARLKARIQKRGFHDVVKVDSDNHILSGNQRKKALTDLGVEEVWTLFPSRALTEEERSKIILESNRNDGEWDYDILTDDFDYESLQEIGFTDNEIGKFKPDEEGLERLDKQEIWLYTCQHCGKEDVFNKQNMRPQD